MNKYILLGLLNVLLWGVLFFVVGCEQSAAVVDEKEHKIEASIEGIRESMAFAMNDGGSKTDSIVELLLPILLTDPIGRDLENWYDLNRKWEKSIGGTGSLLNYAALVFDNFQRKGDFVKSAKVKNAIARIYFIRGDYSQAITEMQASLNLAREAGDSTGVGWAISGFVSPFIHSGNLKTAYEHLQRAIIIGDKTKNIGIQCMNKINLATYYGHLNRLDTAAQVMQEAIAIAREHNLKAAEIYAQLNSGVMLTYSGKIDAAIALLKEDFGLKKGMVTVPNAMLNFNLFEAYLAKGDFEQALPALEKGCMLADSLEFGFGILYCKEGMYLYHEKRGNYQQALNYHKAFLKIKEKQTGEAVAEKIQSLQAIQTIKEKDWEIKNLQAAELEQKAIFKSRRNRLLGLIAFLILITGVAFIIVHSRHQMKSAFQSKTIAETKLQVLQYQMNPHFIYNAITGIQNYILKSEKIEAYTYLGKFADLLRMITKSSEGTNIELDQEVKMIKAYLEMEKLRFREAFSYKIKVSEFLLNSNYEVPSMMVQPVVENAIIHGLSGLSRPGKLVISFELDTGAVKCTITDNGRGRAAAKEVAQQEPELHLSVASMNIQERLDFLREIGYPQAQSKVEDLYENGSPVGTTVTIHLPIII